MAHLPDYINECNCSLCGKLGAWWGYYATIDVVVTGETTTYSRNDKVDPMVAAHFCPQCGNCTHWIQTAGFVAKHPDLAGRMGVNMRLFDREALAGVELRFPDGKGWDGKVAFGYVRWAERL